MTPRAAHRMVCIVSSQFAAAQTTLRPKTVLDLLLPLRIPGAVTCGITERRLEARRCMYTAAVDAFPKDDTTSTCFAVSCFMLKDMASCIQ